jgi:nicotinamide-nucleotide amidase
LIGGGTVLGDMREAQERAMTSDRADSAPDADEEALAERLGGVVAYASSVKKDLLGVTAEKVVSRQAAEEVATGARFRLGADVAVAVTGVAGPDRQDGEPPGTVWIGVDDGRPGE